MARPNVPAVLAEISSTPAPFSAEAVAGSQPSQVSPHSAPAVATLPRSLVVRRNTLFQLNRLGVGLVVLKFGWVWVSCGGFILADSLFCTSDICVIVYKRLKQHVWQMGSRLHYASRESIRLFTETDD